MALPREYFDIQMEYAQTASHLLKIPLYEALRLYTSYWRLIGNQGYSYEGVAFSPQALLWLEFQERSKATRDIVGTAIAMRNENHSAASAHKFYFGCFRFDYFERPPAHDSHPFKEDKKVIKIHFSNNDKDGIGPLRSSKTPQRSNDLKRMFEYIHKHHPQAQVVHGGTWLYNIPAYTRLFPLEYTENLTQEDPFPRTQGMWGQFLTSDGGINSQRVNHFRGMFENATNEIELLNAFPFQIMLARGTISSFYRMYEVTSFS